MSLKPGEYANILSASWGLKWRHVRGEPKGISEIMLHKNKDGSFTHLIRWVAGVEYSEPVAHDFYEEAYYISGEMLNKKTRKKITVGMYVFHKPGEEHGPSKMPQDLLDTRVSVLQKQIRA